MSNSSTLPSEEPATIFYIGEHETDRRSRISVELISGAQNLGYDFLTTPITNARFQDQIVSLAAKCVNGRSSPEGSNSDALGPSTEVRNSLIPSILPLTNEDVCIAPDDSNASLVAIASPWIDLGTYDPIIRRLSRQVFNAEIAYAAFCGISNIIVYGPQPGSDIPQYGRAIYEGLGLGPYINLHILLPFGGELEQDSVSGTQLAELASATNEDELEEPSNVDHFDVWNSWNTIRTICNYSHKLSLALEIPRQLPSINLQARWLSEPVRLLLFQRTSFLRNAKGYPVLSKQHQQLLSRFARLRFPPWMLLSDVESTPGSTVNGISESEPTPAEAASIAKEKPKDPVPHLRYLRHLQHSQPPRPPMERFGQGYQDYLQSPLQPLTDNLESITYEVFEKDPVKYDWYEKAIAAALQYLKTPGGSEDETFTVAVVGAGRGPLVTRALLASQKTGIKVKCFAVEKNPNAFVLLQHHNTTDPLWAGKVNVVKSDMREWDKPRIESQTDYVDILVSELLGSFGDNELSPECLDGVQHVLRPGTGICIPQSYSAHLTPIATPRLYGDLLSRPGTEKWELPWVVMLHTYDNLCASTGSNGGRIPQVREAWSFSHPISSGLLDRDRNGFAWEGNRVGGWVGGDAKNEHNARECKVCFQSSEQGVCHGLAGYFETVLFSKVELSTNPVTMEEKSKDMISWFPIFFPLKTPIYVPKDAEITVSMWRQTDDRSVWYEWLVEVMETVGGRKRRVAISELHSSRKNGCLM